MVQRLSEVNTDMDRNQFISNLKMNKLLPGEAVPKWKIQKVIWEVMNSDPATLNPRGHRNLITAMEELSELSQQISKKLRSKGDDMDLLQELADVLLQIHWIQDICGFSDEELQTALYV